MAREADLKRGWGKSCSKSCAAKKRILCEFSGNRKIAAASVKYSNRYSANDFDPSWDSHKHL